MPPWLFAKTIANNIKRTAKEMPATGGHFLGTMGDAIRR
jgi:hypothetical protein